MSHPTHPPRPFLLIEGDPPRRLELPESGELVLGRDPACDLVLEGDRISERHARILVQDGAWEVEDLGSTQGTRVNGVEVSRAPLAIGDVIQVYRTVLRLLEAEPEVLPEDAGAPPGGQLVVLGRKLLETMTTLLAPGEEGAGVLDRLLDGLLAAFDADRGLVYLPEGQKTQRLACLRSRPGEPATEEQVSRSLIRRIARDREPVLLTSAETEELRQEIHSIAADLRSIVAAPMPLEKGVGVVYLDSRVERRRFFEWDKQLLLAFTRAAGELLHRERAGRRVARRGEHLAEIQRRELAAEELLGQSVAVRGLVAEIAKVAATDVSVLLIGESGTGKELAARALHRSSARAGGSFVALNCAALPAELVESELFGHEKGAFSGAAARKLGRFELAEGGTLFLDEIGELPLGLQGKILRALEERRIQRVGGAGEIPVDFRLVAATNVDLEAAVRERRFREDLYFRIAVFRVGLPPLRERDDDVILLAEHFLRRFGRELRRGFQGLDESARQLLREYSWPGNVRELRNVVHQAVIRQEGELLTAASIRPALGLGELRPAAAATAGAALPPVLERYPPTLEAARRQFETELVEEHLERNAGNMKQTAVDLGITRKNLYAKCADLGIDHTRFR